ncbi:MAG: UTRA domain-containing protein [Hungatella sp.]|jgi:GntR family transcriptional regulator/GntR family frlABCD operon transcriptional regulator|nr:UTRA domain-containing protein [Hungatella sp.]
MLDQNALVPLYEQLKDAIKDDIKAKIYCLGERIPSEAALEEKYRVSRITVRRAVKELCEEEILVRKQGKGTFVLNMGLKNWSDRLCGFHDSIERQGRKASTKILEKSIIHVNASYAEDLKIGTDDDVVYLKRIMYADDIPMMVNMCYLPLKRFPGIVDRMTGDFSVFRIMENDYCVNLKGYHKVLKVRRATKEFSRYLQCHTGEPLFDLFKITYNTEEVPQHIAISVIKSHNTSYVLSSDEDDRMTHVGISWKI